MRKENENKIIDNKHYELYKLSTKLNERLFGNKLLIINTGKE